ncbi:MAG: cytochrome c [Candidatus Thiosymbion ectosymbiont of Robbea hypermnestra]|nr:cytochrome c [Candidatus Thiosymbion ectosymbiont of Robbea hypermnestra]
MHTPRTGLLALTLALCAAGTQAGDIEKAVDYRQGLMNVYVYNVTAMGNMVKGKTPFDPTAFARHAKDLATAARLDLLAGFPEDSINDESDADDKIWLDWDKFQQKNQALRKESARLAEIAKGGDETAMKTQFKKTAKTCKGCHDNFKH